MQSYGLLHLLTMRSFLLASIVLVIFSNLNAQLALVPDSTAYTRCVQEEVKVKFTLTNDTNRVIYFWWGNRSITPDPRNDWRISMRDLRGNKTLVEQTDLEFRYPRYIVESIRGTPYWKQIRPREEHNLGSSSFGEIINTRKPGKYSFEIGFRYNWGDTLEFVPAGSPNFSWGEVDTTWATIKVNFKNCPDSIYFTRATNKWNKWITYKDDYTLLYYCAESQHFNMVDSIIALLEDNHNILTSNAGIRTVSMIAGKGISHDQTKKLIEGFAEYNFNRQNDPSYNASEDHYRNRIFSLITANTTIKGFPYILGYFLDESAEIRKSVLYAADKYKIEHALQFFKNDSDREIRQQAKRYIKNHTKHQH